jgi:hypothetical protein
MYNTYDNDKLMLTFKESTCNQHQSINTAKISLNSFLGTLPRVIQQKMTNLGHANNAEKSDNLHLLHVFISSLHTRDNLKMVSFLHRDEAQTDLARKRTTDEHKFM